MLAKQKCKCQRCLSAVEKQQKYHSYRNSSICDIEDILEKFEFLPAKHRYPAGPSKGKKWEIKHIHHLPLKLGSIPVTVRKHRRHLRRHRIIEYLAIEHAVEDITG